MKLIQRMRGGCSSNDCPLGLYFHKSLPHLHKGTNGSLTVTNAASVLVL